MAAWAIRILSPMIRTKRRKDKEADKGRNEAERACTGRIPARIRVRCKPESAPLPGLAERMKGEVAEHYAAANAENNQQTAEEILLSILGHLPLNHR
jgi:hypothetical protein